MDSRFCGNNIKGYGNNRVKSGIIEWEEYTPNLSHSSRGRR